MLATTAADSVAVAPHGRSGSRSSTGDAGDTCTASPLSGTASAMCKKIVCVSS